VRARRRRRGDTGWLHERKLSALEKKVLERLPQELDGDEDAAASRSDNVIAGASVSALVELRAELMIEGRLR